MGIDFTAMQRESETRTCLENITWNTFTALCDERRGAIPRMTYDEGTLELMNPRYQHENIGKFIGRIVETYSEVRNIDLFSSASTTFKRPDLLKGFEADQSYYIAHCDNVLGKDDIDLSVDPPPDLVIEVEITSSAIEKLPLFARMGIPELWRHDGQRLTMFRLFQNQYLTINRSDGLPGLSNEMMEQVLARRSEMSETQNIKLFRRSISESPGSN